MTKLVFRIKDLDAKEAQETHVAQALDRAFLASALQEAGVDVDQSAVQMDARLISQPPNVLLKGSLRGQLAVQCQRCLGPAALPIDIRLQTTFAPPGAAEEEDEDLVDPDDEDYAHHDREVVDLTTVLREQLLLSLPITVLCKEDCQGLCPVCGADKNVTSCACETTVSISPFAVLKNLKQ